MNVPVATRSRDAAPIPPRALTGTHRQIAFAESIRAAMCKWALPLIADWSTDCADDESAMTDVADLHWILGQTDARFYIENRRLLYSPTSLFLCPGDAKTRRDTLLVYKTYRGGQ